ncbi:MAG: histidinol-phosphate aminotransferase family protein, partial [Armatimonadota bacterium]|nr:histidinol-phosphate aminotransferase family protein [Armatimonadota bacterium]
RDQWPFPVSDTLYEIRLLTVREQDRGGLLAALLMYAAFRCVESRGGTQIMAMGRRALKALYQKAGLRFFGVIIRSGAVEYELMGAELAQLRAQLSDCTPLLCRLRFNVTWNLSFPFGVACTHGGEFFGVIGDTFQTLERRREVVNADVLDAWFPPAPGALAAIQDHLPWLLQTSPPVDGAGLMQTIADVRGVPPESLVLGAGSSALIYLALCRWLTPNSRVLLPDPTYGEYAHVLEQVIGCRVDRLALSPTESGRLELDHLRARLRQTSYDLVILVNPNNPTGGFLPRVDLERALADIPSQTRVWIDEAYLDYMGREESLEAAAAQSRNVFVCKSLSKCYALSGARAAYLCGPPPLISELRRFTPPWNVSLPAQVAAVAALNNPAYYAQRYAETAVLRDDLVTQLRRNFPDWDIRPSPANWALCFLPLSGPDAATIVQRCRAQNVFLRDAASISPRLGNHTLRIAVKDAESSTHILAALLSALAGP